MPKRATQKYTRYVNDSNEEDDEDPERADGVVEQDLDDEEQNHMQEGRRVLAMMTPKTTSEGIGISRAETGRLIFAMVLTTALCFTFGALFGYYIRNNSFSKVPVPVMCPNISQPTTTPVPPQILSPVTPVEAPEDIPGMMVHFLSHLTPELIKNYVSNISRIEVDELKDYIEGTLESQDFTVEVRAFPIMSSVADKGSPNVVEIVKGNKSEVVNNNVESLDDFQPFSGFSPNGTAAGPLVYANYASEKDFATLLENKIEVNGSILLIRLCNVHPGIQVHHAEKRGAIGVILYPDPKEFGGIVKNWSEIKHERSVKNWSNIEDRVLPPDGVVWQNLRMIPGDPSTPYYASQKYIYRIPSKDFVDVASIVVQPVSSESALALLKVLNGSQVPNDWKGNLQTTYRFGGSFVDNVDQVRIISNNKIVETHQHVVFAYLPAKDHSKVVHVGCHFEIKDKLITSSGIGLAGFLALGNALKKTFPNGTDRLVVLTAFEGRDGDFSVGNEFSQLYSWWLESTAMAYIDMDTILEGKGFVEANVSPVLREVAREAFHHVSWVGKEGLTLNQGLASAIRFRIHTSSNKTGEPSQESFAFTNPYECDESANFVNLHGIPSLQLTSININKSENFFMRNSQYDTMKLIQRFEDDDLHWTHMIVSAMGASVLLLSCTALPPVRFDEIGWDISKAWKNFLTEERNTINKTEHEDVQYLFDRITSEMDNFILTSESYDTWYRDRNNIENSTPLGKLRKLDSRLNRFQQFGRRFLRPRNIPHYGNFGSLLTYGPDPENSCQGTYFPYIRQALKEAREGKSSWDILYMELSLLLSVLMDIRTDS